MLYFLSLILISNSTSNIFSQVRHSISKYGWALPYTKHFGALNLSSKTLPQCGHSIIIIIIYPPNFVWWGWAV